MTNILDEIVAHKRLEIEQKKAQASVATLDRDFLRRDSAQYFMEAIRSQQQEGLFQLPRLILEVKPASPSAGVMAEKLDLEALLKPYTHFGNALSVLTDQSYFKGSFDLLRSVKAQTPLPILCKDFILDSFQVYEALQAGASAVLLIVKILSDGELQQLSDLIREVGLVPVVEVQNEAELQRALAINPEVILINNRNLEDFTIDFDTTFRLAPLIPPDVILISASGIETRHQIQDLLPVCGAFLIGSALMKTPIDRLGEKLRELLNENPD